MKLKSLGWLLILLLAWLVAFVATVMAWAGGAAWALALLGVVWGAFFLAESRRWVPVRDMAWAAGAGYGFGVIRWFDMPSEAASGMQRWLLMGACALCLAFFVLIAPALLGWIAERFRPQAEPELPTEKPPSPEMWRRWDPKD